MNNDQRICIYLPAFEDAILLDACIRSLDHLRKRKKLLILDDSLTDNIYKYISRIYPDEKCNVKYFERRRGETTTHIENWNRVFEMLGSESQYDWFQVRHHDDHLLMHNSTGVEKFYSAMESDKYKLIISPVVKMVLRTKHFKIYRYHTHPILIKLLILCNKRVLYYYNYIGPTGSLWLRNTLENRRISFNPKLTWLVDCDWYVSLLNATNKEGIFITHAPYTLSAENKNSITLSLKTQNISAITKKERTIVIPCCGAKEKVLLIAIGLFARVLNIFLVILNPVVYSNNTDNSMHK